MLLVFAKIVFLVDLNWFGDICGLVVLYYGFCFLVVLEMLLLVLQQPQLDC